MPKYQIDVTEAAEKDLIEIVDYIADDNPGAALKLAGKIEKNILKLAVHPLIGAIPKVRRLARKGYRMLIVDDYLVFYVVLDDKRVEIRRILSGKRDYKFLF
jgi:toxin ParE1/3/4